MISDQWRLGTGCSDVLFKRIVFQSFIRMASAADIAKLETKAVAAEKLIELLRQQISQVGERCVKLCNSGFIQFRSRQPRLAATLARRQDSVRRLPSLKLRILN